MNNGNNKLRLVRLGIDTLTQFIIYIRSDCFICRSEGFVSETQILVSINGKSIIATLHVIQSDIIKIDEASLSENAWQYLNAKEGDYVTLEHTSPVTSLKFVRSKVYGNKLNQSEFNAIIEDVVAGKYSNAQLACFITACARENLTIEEIISLTRSMINTGETMKWDYHSIMDKHSVGGIPGNRTTPIVVAIIASAGLTIPKTSSRSITSPAGTADTVETMTPVNLSIAQIRHVVEKEGGCMAWGGSLGISPADDIIIRVERSLDIDPEGQMIASVLSKKAAIGATDVVIDIPVGITAKIRTDEKFVKLKDYFTIVGYALGLNVYVIKTDGLQPVGIGIGPALEAKDILAILRNEKHNLQELKDKALLLSAILLKAGKKISLEKSMKLAKELLENGSAYNKFLAICEAQGGFHEPRTASYTHDILSTHEGYVGEIDNRNLGTIAKLAGAPHDQAAGIEFFAKLGRYIKKGEILYRIHAESKGELEYALSFSKTIPNLIKIIEK